MIVGVGTDIVELVRIQSINLEKFAIRILTESERQILPKRENLRSQFLAGRFAAKEAISKALGTGIGKQFSFQDVSVLPNPDGKPQVITSAAFQNRFQDADRWKIHLSISHTDQHAVAMAVIEQQA